MLKKLFADACFYHQIYFPGRATCLISWLHLILRARGLWLLAVLRLSAYYTDKYSQGKALYPWLLLIRMLLSLGHFLCAVILKSEVHTSILLTGSIYFSHRGHIIFGAQCVGDGTIIQNCVTIGMKVPYENKPKIGRNVWIGRHCVIYGDITIGDGVTVLPNTVLTKSVPANVVVRGNPAQIVATNINNSALRQSVQDDSVIDQYVVMKLIEFSVQTEKV